MSGRDNSTAAPEFSGTSGTLVLLITQIQNSGKDRVEIIEMALLGRLARPNQFYATE